MTATEIQKRREEIERLIPRAETGEQWAYICLLESRAALAQVSE